MEARGGSAGLQPFKDINSLPCEMANVLKANKELAPYEQLVLKLSKVDDKGVFDCFSFIHASQNSDASLSMLRDELKRFSAETKKLFTRAFPLGSLSRRV